MWQTWWISWFASNYGLEGGANTDARIGGNGDVRKLQVTYRPRLNRSTAWIASNDVVE